MILQMKILGSFLNSIKNTIYKGVMNLKKYNGDYNSSKNQRIKGKLVDEAVLSFQSLIVDYILKKSFEDIDTDAPFTYNDIENPEKYPDVFEWWEVKSWLADELYQLGECVIRNGCNNYWGRTTTGQAILLDYVISRIADDMEILEGQENDWSKDDNV